nr:putative reverse transcriptase domain-containing protein [Tanacetum cinerariifolium]
ANVVADALSRKNFGTMACLKIQPEIIKDLKLMEVELVVHDSEGYIASLKIEPNLILQIKEAQKEDGELWSVVQNIKKGKQEEFRVDEHGVIWYDRWADRTYYLDSEGYVEIMRFGVDGKLRRVFIGYNYHPYHVVQYLFDKIREDLSFTEEPEAILDRQERVMRKKTIPLVKVLWKIYPEREAT